MIQFNRGKKWTYGAIDEKKKFENKNSLFDIERTKTKPNTYSVVYQI